MVCDISFGNSFGCSTLSSSGSKLCTSKCLLFKILSLNSHSKYSFEILILWRITVRSSAWSSKNPLSKDIALRKKSILMTALGDAGPNSTATPHISVPPTASYQLPVGAMGDDLSLGRVFVFIAAVTLMASVKCFKSGQLERRQERYNKRVREIERERKESKRDRRGRQQK